MSPRLRHLPLLPLPLLLALLALAPSPAAAQSGVEASRPVFFGVRVSAGGRFDNVRKCVASSPGTRGGVAADISFVTEVGLTDSMSLVINVPVMRPILFATAFKLLQLEPDVALVFRRRVSDSVDVIAGPTLGISLHYGPDYRSESSGPGRTASFFAMGPMIGGYLGFDFKRPEKSFNFQLGLQPYAIPLFGVSDPADHKGVVVGGMLEGTFRFKR